MKIDLSELCMPLIDYLEAQFSIPSYQHKQEMFYFGGIFEIGHCKICLTWKQFLYDKSHYQM